MASISIIDPPVVVTAMIETTHDGRCDRLFSQAQALSVGLRFLRGFLQPLAPKDA